MPWRDMAFNIKKDKFSPIVCFMSVFSDFKNSCLNLVTWVGSGDMLTKYSFLRTSFFFFCLFICFSTQQFWTFWPFLCLCYNPECCQILFWGLHVHLPMQITHQSLHLCIPVAVLPTSILTLIATLWTLYMLSCLWKSMFCDSCLLINGIHTVLMSILSLDRDKQWFVLFFMTYQAFTGYLKPENSFTL